MSFRWQTDDDADEPIVSDENTPLGNPRLRRALWLVAALAFVSIASFLAWRTVQQRAAEAQERVKADVLSTHELARRAANAGDEELYLSLMPPEIEAWTTTQEELLQNDLLFAGAARLYDLVPLRSAVPTTEVTLDASLSQATVLAQQSFAFTSTASFDESITLRQAQTYSLGDGGWRVAPPPPTFWSTQVTLHGEALSVQYPERDEAVALRLMSQLERLLPQMCALPGLSCPPDFRLMLRLVPDATALSRAASPEALLGSGSLRADTQLDLPAPSLAGQPVDEAGEDLVVRTYAARAIAPLISHLSGYECCARGLLVRAILERQLHHLDLRAWPLAPDHYEALMEEGLTLGNALVLQARDATPPPPETWHQMLSLVEFLEASLPSGELLSYMDASLDYWLLRADDPGHFIVQWTEFVYDRSRSARLAEDLDPLPRGAIQLTCFEAGAVAVQRYVLQGAGWQHGLTHATQEGWQVEAVFPLPADYGNVIQESRRDAAGERVARYVWRHAGGATVLFETMPGEDGKRLFAPYDGSAPHWRYTVLSPAQTALRESLEREWWQLDLTVCDRGACQPQERIARPRWSPDGARLLLEARPETPVWNRDDLRILRAGNRGQNAVDVGRGFEPVWLNAAHYAFLRAAERRSGHELLVSAMTGDGPRVVATSDDFVASIDENLPGGLALQLAGLQAHPTDPYILLVRATRPPIAGDINPDSFLFAARLAPDMQQLAEIELLFHSDGGLDFRPSPNGRWVAATDYDMWTLIDLQQGGTRALSGLGAPAWSPDGEWLAQSRDYHIMLHAPALDYKRPIVHELGDCPFSSLQWQSR